MRTLHLSGRIGDCADKANRREDILWKYCKANNALWNIICPAWIIGAVNNAAMNALHPLAVYAAVQAHKNEPLHYPGDIEAW